MPELVLSLAVMTLVAGAAASAMLVVSHALPDAERAAVEETWHVLVRMEQELAYATTFNMTDPAEVRFEVADRGHGAVGPEEFHYLWGTKAGDPLTRQYNGGATVTVLDDVHYFNVTYHTKSDAGSGNVICSVTIELQAGSDTASRQQAEIRILNEPAP